MFPHFSAGKSAPHSVSTNPIACPSFATAFCNHTSEAFCKKGLRNHKTLHWGIACVLTAARSDFPHARTFAVSTHGLPTQS
jgi:hypothetical protein